MKSELNLAFDSEMATAISLYRMGQHDQAFGHLETAHILGQLHVVPHVRSHWWMLKIGLKRRAVAEVWGQAVRIVLGALGSSLGTVPKGNPGGTNVGMFAEFPVEPRLVALIAAEKWPT
jgi:hypothetical protein